MYFIDGVYLIEYINIVKIIIYIVIVYVLTMAMVPNLTLLLDLRKPKHPPLPIFEKVVQVPIKWSKAVIAFFLVMIFISGFLLSWVSTFFAVRKFIKQNESELYN